MVQHQNHKIKCYYQFKSGETETQRVPTCPRIERVSCLPHRGGRGAAESLQMAWTFFSRTRFGSIRLGLPVPSAVVSSEHEFAALKARVCQLRGTAGSGSRRRVSHAALGSLQVPRLHHPYFPSTHSQLQGPQGPFLCPPSLGLGSRASWPFSEAIKAPILQTQLCQPSAPCPSPVSAHCHVPRLPGSGCLCRVQGLQRGSACLGPHPRVWESGAGVQKLEGHVSSHCDCDWRSVRKGPGLTGAGGELVIELGEERGRFCFLNLGHGLSFVTGWRCWWGGVGERSGN